MKVRLEFELPAKYFDDVMAIILRVLAIKKYKARLTRIN